MSCDAIQRPDLLVLLAYNDWQQLKEPLRVVVRQRKPVALLGLDAQVTREACQDKDFAGHVVELHTIAGVTSHLKPQDPYGLGGAFGFRARFDDSEDARRLALAPQLDAPVILSGVTLRSARNILSAVRVAEHQQTQACRPKACTTPKHIILNVHAFGTPPHARHDAFATSDKMSQLELLRSHPIIRLLHSVLCVRAVLISANWLPRVKKDAYSAPFWATGNALWHPLADPRGSIADAAHMDRAYSVAVGHPQTERRLGVLCRKQARYTQIRHKLSDVCTKLRHTDAHTVPWGISVADTVVFFMGGCDAVHEARYQKALHLFLRGAREAILSTPEKRFRFILSPHPASNGRVERDALKQLHSDVLAQHIVVLPPQAQTGLSSEDLVAAADMTVTWNAPLNTEAALLNAAPAPTSGAQRLRPAAFVQAVADDEPPQPCSRWSQCINWAKSRRGLAPQLDAFAVVEAGLASHLISEDAVAQWLRARPMTPPYVDDATHFAAAVLPRNATSAIADRLLQAIVNQTT